MNRAKTIRIWMLAGRDYGLGHVIRGRRLGTELSRRFGVSVKYRVNCDFEAGAKELAGESVLDISAPLTDEGKIDLEIIDALDPDDAFVARVKSSGAQTVCFENGVASGRLADVVVNPIIEGLQSGTRRVGATTYYFGSDYLFLDSRLVEVRRRRESRRTGRLERIFVSCGGTDPRGRSNYALTLLSKLGFSGSVDLVMGSGSSTELGPSLVDVPFRLEILRSLPSLADLYVDADLAMVSGGLTLFESASVGVPTLVLPQNDHQTVTGHRFEAIGASRVLTLDPERDRVIFEDVRSEGVRASMAKSGCSAIDGRAEALFDLFSQWLNVKVKGSDRQ